MSKPFRNSLHLKHC